MLTLGSARESELRRTIAEARQRTERILERPPSCFGAAARDPRRRCDDRSLAVVPTPIEARDSPNAPCTRVERTGLLNVCAFGARKARSVATVALIGDSHASHWRATVDVVAEEKRWRGLSIARTDCPLSAAVREIPEPRRSECVRWRQEVLAWLAAHPEVTRIFVSQSAAGAVAAAGGVSQLDAQIEGYQAAWRRVPSSVKRIVVLRDTPRALPHGATLACVEEAMRDRRPAGRACALPRSQALRPDPAAIAAQSEPRAVVVDLTRFFCDARRCLAVVGGALVHRDVSHMMTTFATTLGPYLLRALA